MEEIFHEMPFRLELTGTTYSGYYKNNDSSTPYFNFHTMMKVLFELSSMCDIAIYNIKENTFEFKLKGENILHKLEAVTRYNGNVLYLFDTLKDLCSKK